MKGHNYIGNQQSAKGTNSFFGYDPTTNAPLTGTFYEATTSEINEAIQKAQAAFDIIKDRSGEERASFLVAIADEIMALGDSLILRARSETALPEGRLTGERGRTCNQLRLFASVLRDGSWVQAKIDPAMPDREPMPRADIRSMLRPLGPVAVFGASNFPLAFSVAGGDTASALAAGCPVVVKAHPAHPGTCELIADAIIAAAQKTNMPEGIFSMVHGVSHEVGGALVKHPAIQAVGFTGSLRGGRTLYDLAASRPEPIPVYAEMGSTNPVFILPEALVQQHETLADGLFSSVTLGVGQFCTNPGLVISEQSAQSKQLLSRLSTLISESQAGVMLTSGIQGAYEKGLTELSEQSGVATSAKSDDNKINAGAGCLLSTDAQTFLSNKDLEEEVFGPSTLHVATSDMQEMMAIAKNLHGHLTATIHGTEADLKDHSELISILEKKVGRILINGYPTGVEVNNAMVHGGPYPATTDARSTSVGTGAITRFARPVCYQNFPDYLLPDELKEHNPLGIKRLVNGKWE